MGTKASILAAGIALSLLLAGCGGRGGIEEEPAGGATETSSADRLQAAFEKGVETISAGGHGAVEVRGHVQGAENDYYGIVGEAGDKLNIVLEPSNQALYFEVLRSRNGASMFRAGDTGVHEWTGGLPADDTYVIRVYLYPSAVRYNEQSDYLLRVDLQPPTLGGKPVH